MSTQARKVKTLPPKWPKTDSRLLGTWKSDRRRTFAEWSWGENVSPKKKEKLKSLFGKLLITYTRSRIIWNLPHRKWVNSRRYTILGTDEASVAIVVSGELYIKDPKKYDRFNLQTVKELWSKPEIRQIHFAGNHYWISIGNGKNREFFRRIREGKKSSSR